MRAIVTAGGTREPIDEVRVVTNLSTGRLGVAMARALAARGAEVTLLAGATVEVVPQPGIEVARFGTAAELDERIDDAIAGKSVDLFLMAAAVSDWAPVRTDGKLTSGGEDLVLHLRPVAKILPTLRDRCDESTVIVGFKLLSGVTDEKLVDAARAQIREARTDGCVANDVRRIGERHAVTIVGKDGSVSRHEGTKDEVARAVVERVWRTG